MAAQATALVTSTLGQAGDLLVAWAPLFALVLALPVLGFVAFLIRDLIQR
jgi:hypothetical protein